MEKTSPQPLALFYCYARKDHILRDELDQHLAGLRRTDLITTWYDGEIRAGITWEAEIKTQLDTADVILLLVSSDFINSDYCYGIEMKRALERHTANEARVIPILLRPVNWAGTPLNQLQMLPTDALPISKWKNRDEAFADVAMHIRDVIIKLIEHRKLVGTGQEPKTVVDDVIPSQSQSRSNLPPSSARPAWIQRFSRTPVLTSSLLTRFRSTISLPLIVLLLLIITIRLFFPTLPWEHQQSPIVRGQSAPFVGNANLGNEGNLDWAHWGYLGGDDINPNRFVGNPVATDCQYSFHCFNHKQGGNNQIRDYRAIGNVSPFRLHVKDDPVLFSWYGGAPIVEATDVRAGEYMGLANNGFQITVAADQTIRTLKLYVSVHQGQAKLTATLSDTNAPIYEDTNFNTYGGWNQSKFAVYTLTYEATAPNQFLTITYTLQTDIGGGNVMLYAATLSGSSSNTNVQASAPKTPTSTQSYAQATNHTPIFVDSLQGGNSNGHNWRESDNDTYGSCFFKEGAYHVTANPQSDHFCGASGLPRLVNFAFQGEVIMMHGTGGGFTFRFTSPNYGYLFYISQDGTYTITAEIGSNSVFWQHESSAAINTRPGESNLLAVLARDNTFDFYVNNQHVTSFSDNTYSTGYILNLAMSSSNDSTEVVFRNMKVWTL